MRELTFFSPVLFFCFTVFMFNCAGRDHQQQLSVHQSSLQSELVKIGNSIKGQKFPMGGGVLMHVVDPFNNKVEFYSQNRTAVFVYGTFRQTGESQASLMCPHLGNASFKVDNNYIVWSINEKNRQELQRMLGVSVQTSGVIKNESNK